jgi:uncharacterized membrane protein YeiH
MPLVNTDMILQIQDCGAVLASAVAGMIMAAPKRMDLVGAFALA